MDANLMIEMLAEVNDSLQVIANQQHLARLEQTDTERAKYLDGIQDAAGEIQIVVARITSALSDVG